MKKRFLCLFLALTLLGTGCAQSQQGEPQAPTAPETSAQNGEGDPSAELLIEEYLADLNILQSPVREYGESTSYMQMEDDFVARILYPLGDLEHLDTAIVKWVADTADQYRVESAGSGVDSDGAELTVDYSSYVIKDALVSVKLSGIYDRPYLAHPVDVSASFNADRTTGKLLALEDLLLPGGEEKLRHMVIEDAALTADAVDENLLDHWLVTTEGLEITLVRGDYLPMSDGTVTLLYPYEELNGILSLAASVMPEMPESDTQQPLPAPDGNPPVPSIDPSKPMLALTFDDGPSAHTERLLDVFATHGGRGTFYVVGNMLDGRADTLRRIAAEGHEIGGHSWNHRQLTKLSEEELTDQLMSTRAKIYSITGVDAATVRPPYGSCNDLVKSKAEALGISLINWSVDTLDWKNKNADAVYQAVMKEAKDGAIILCHDLHKTTVDAMERAIPALIAKGYQLVTVTELLTCDGDAMIAGKVYFKR